MSTVILKIGSVSQCNEPGENLNPSNTSKQSSISLNVKLTEISFDKTIFYQKHLRFCLTIKACLKKRPHRVYPFGSIF